MSVNVAVLISVPKSLLLSLILTLQPLISCNLYFLSLSKRPWIFRNPKREPAQPLHFFLCSLLPNVTIFCITGRHKKKRTKRVLSKYCDVDFRSQPTNGMWQQGASATKGTSPFCTAIVFFQGPFQLFVETLGKTSEGDLNMHEQRCMNKACLYSRQSSF